ncbi:MAG: acyltransferase [Lachnospiraceae bacterium]|nr:acyltransferase [Lachnospiraceae bacterium]
MSKKTTDRKGSSNQQITPSPYALLSSYRGELMGIATLAVMYLHTMIIGLSAEKQPFRFMQRSSHIGVEIFILLSGFGLYHSLQKNTIKDYFLKRMARLMPAWASFLLIHLIVDKLVFGLSFSLKEIIGFLTFQGFRAGLGNQGNWYVYTIFLYYLIAPVPYSFLKESKHKFTTFLLLFSAVYLASYSYFGNRDLLITFIRLPIFILGMYLAAAADSGADKITKSVTQPMGKAGLLACALLTLLFGAAHYFVLLRCSDDVLWDYGLWWHGLLFLVTPLCLLLCRLFSLIDFRQNGEHKKNPLTGPLRIIGSASLEIFLIHLYIFKYWGEITGILLRKSVSFRIGIFFLSILLGILWHLLLTLIISLFRKKTPTA